MSIGFRARGGRRRRSGAGSGARIALVALGLLCLGAAAATAQVLIDDFSTAQAGTSLQDPPDLPGATQGATQGGAGMIGGQRDLFLTWIAGGIGPVSTSVTGGSLLFSTTADSDASVLVTWDGDTDPANLDPSGLGGADLTAGGASALQLSVDSSDAGIELILTVFTNAADFSTSAQVLPAVAGSTDFFFPFSSFVADPGGSGADFTAVGAVTLLVQGSGTNTGSALSFSADFIDTVTPAISALQVDQPGTPAAPGDTITFEATIENTGGQGTGVTFEETLDTNVTIVPGSVKTSPLARNDSFSGIGNVGLTVAAPGLLANDVDLDDAGPSSLVVTTIGAVPTAQGGTATLAADGSFTYAPPAGFQGVDGFSYSVVDDEAETDSASAVITLDAIVWFVENDACTPHPCGSGTFADPFSSLKQAEAVSAAGHIIRLREGDGTTTNNDQGLIKQDGQLLIGSGVDLVVNGQTIETATTRPAMTHVAGNGIDLASENTIRGLDIAGASGAALFGTGVGTVTVTEVDVTDSGGAALDIDGGTLAMTFGTLDSLSSSGHGIHLRNVGGSLSATTTNLEDPTDTGIRVATSAGASFDFGTTTITNAGDAGGADAGIDLATSGPATFTFSSLSSTTENGAGLVANGSGTVSIGGTTNTISATGGPALDVTNTDLGTGWTFSSLTSSASPTEGIRLDTISDPLTVNTATTVTNPDTTGILVQNSSDVPFDFGSTSVTDAMVGAGNTANGIDLLTGNTGASFTFDSLSVTTDGGFGLRSGASTLAVGGGTNTINATGGAALDLTNTSISGTATFSALSSSSSPGTGINLNGVTGGLTANGGSITGATGNAFDVAGGNGAVTYNGSIGNTSGRAVEITGRNSGATHAISLGGAIAETGTGIRLDDNDVATITFSGGLTLDTGASTAFAATNGGTVNATGTNRIGSNTALSTTAINIQNTSLGAAGVTFRDVHVNGGPVGIDIDGGGSGGFFTITGTGTTDASGGTIQNTTQNGVLIENTDNITLNNLTLSNANTVDGGGAGVCDGAVFSGCNAALEFNTVASIDIDNLDLTGGAEHGVFGSGVTDFDLSGSTISGAGNANHEHGVFLANLLGTTAGGTGSSVNGTTITNSGNHNMFVRNTTATSPGNAADPDLIQISSSFFTNLLVANPSQALGLLINSRNSANMRLEVTGDNNDATVEFSNLAAGGIRLNGDGGDLQSSITDTTFGPGANNLGGGIESLLTGDSTHAFTFHNNDITINAVAAVEPAGVRVSGFDTSTFDGDVTNNEIRNAAGTSTIFGISVKHDQGSGAGNSLATVSGNTIVNDATLFGGRGIEIQSGGSGNRRLDVIVSNNSITFNNVTGFTESGIFGSAGQNISGEASVLCIDFNNNNATFGASILDEYVLVQHTTSTFIIDGLTGSGTDAANVESFVESENTTGTAIVAPAGVIGPPVDNVVNFSTGTCNS